ncbi:SGNH/GDSL hydrolase family protein [Gordonia sp. CPCC 205515]|uniref:SGNH/GDSL hydrolase family protein n=1 Tax=Gordonia sp. CPCC 205515 TaxID=3140791 RepID=UPI003AF38C94
MMTQVVARVRRLDRGVLIALVILAAVAITFGVLASTGNDRPDPAGVAVIGGSVTAGADNRVVWPTLLARHTGLPVANLAQPGAGFAADGAGGHAYTYQADRAAATRFPVVLVATEQADNEFVDSDSNAIAVGVRDVLNKIAMNGQRALVVGPTWYEPQIPETVRRVADAVRQVAESAGVPFLNALDPPWLNFADMKSDYSGPNDRGQAVIADKVAAWLRTEGIR